jgi:HlyD family secretion protein
LDRPLPQKKYSSRRVLGIMLGVLLLGTSYFAVVSLSATGSNRISAKGLEVGVVEKGGFKEFIALDGVVMPIKTIYLDARESGRVEEVFVEDGAIVKAGTPILKLSNTDLKLDLMNRETALFDLLNNMNNTRINLEQNRIRLQNQVADAVFAWQEAERSYKMNKQLYAQQAIAPQDFQQSKNNFEYQSRKKELALHSLMKDSLLMHTQLAQMELSRQRLTENLSLMQAKTADLVVKAPIDGQITSLLAEVGEAKARGQRLGQIDVVNHYKIRCSIDELYLNRIFPGVTGIGNLNNDTILLKILKIYPLVSNGKFQVDMELDKTAASKLRRGQTLPINLALGTEKKAVILPRGAFFNTTGGHWIYKMGKDGTYAEKINIRLGRQNPYYYEVEAGLEPGDKVIIGSYINFPEAEKVTLQ